MLQSRLPLASDRRSPDCLSAADLNGACDAGARRPGGRGVSLLLSAKAEAAEPRFGRFDSAQFVGGCRETPGEAAGSPLGH